MTLRASWPDETKETIENCWKKSNILLNTNANSDPVVDKMPDGVELLEEEQDAHPPAETDIDALMAQEQNPVDDEAVNSDNGSGNGRTGHICTFCKPVPRILQIH